MRGVPALLATLAGVASAQETDPRSRALEAIRESSFAEHEETLDRALVPTVLLDRTPEDRPMDPNAWRE